MYKKRFWEFPGGPVTKTLHFHCMGVQVRSLVGELRSCMLHAATKKNPISPALINSFQLPMCFLLCMKTELEWFFKVEALTDCIFLGSRITVDADCSHEIKRHLLPGRKVMTKLDSVLKSRDITSLTKVHIVKSMVFQ